MDLGVHPLGGNPAGIEQAVVARRAGPAHGELECHRPRFEPQVAGPADALDVVDRLDLVGLRQQDREAAVTHASDEVGLAGEAPDGVGHGGHEPLAGRIAEAGCEPLEPVELDHHDRRGPPVAADAGVLVGHDPAPAARAEQPGEHVARWALGVVDGTVVPVDRTGIAVRDTAEAHRRATRWHVGIEQHRASRRRSRHRPAAAPRHAWDDHGQGDQQCGGEQRSDQQIRDGLLIHGPNDSRMKCRTRDGCRRTIRIARPERYRFLPHGTPFR